MFFNLITLDELHFICFVLLIPLQIIIFGDKVILEDPIEMYVMRTQVIDNLINNSFRV